MKKDQLSNMSAQGGIITIEFLELMKGETVKNPSVKPQAFATFKHPAPENQKKLDENISNSFYNLVERWDSISNFYENMDISDARGKWIIPLLRELGFDPGFNREDIEVDGDEHLKFRLSHRGWISPEAPMVHTVAPRQDLEAKTIGGKKKPRSPHDEMQTFLNISKDHKWGVVTNGISFRILRDFFHTTTKGYVEFDVENIMRERSYSDYRAFYRMAQASRFRGNGDNGDCPLELFYKQSVTAGVKVGQNLKNNVKKAIEVFGNGFLTPELTQQMIADEKFCGKYYSEILRVIYRLLFLLYAEQRAMLPTRKSLYIDEYSITCLRETAETYNGKDDHCDLWEGLKVTFQMLAQGCEPLRVFPYNGSLFDDSNIPTIRDQKITNYNLLEAIRCLTLVEEEHVLKRINYLDLGVEEIGSIYESLLDYTPRSSAIEINGTTIPGNRFFLDPRGSARKTTGSYYTDKRLVDELIKSALKPVAQKKVKECDDKEAAILSLKVCDPACGSGAFLIAATKYLGKELAKIRTDQSEPPDEDIQRARRDVLQRCIYGVDLNPMVVELAKVSLWIDAAVSDLPLNFLDHHIKCGNSLIGTTAELIDKGIPDGAFSPVEGDDKEFAKEIKAKNKTEKEHHTLGEFKRVKEPTWAEELGKLSDIEENDSDSVKWKQECYNAIIDSPRRHHEKLIADAWCAAFFWQLDKNAPSPLTEAMLRMLQKDTGDSLDPRTESMIRKLADKYRFFHWHLEFPDVFEGEERGFDCVLGNPPWERVKLQEKEFFEYRDEEIANAQNKSKREKLINKLQENMSPLYMEFKKALRASNVMSKFFRDSRRFELTARGDINYYPLFAELNKTIINSWGRVGMVIASGIATDFYTQDFFQNIIADEQLVSLYDFENREGIFPGIHRSYKFSLLTLTGKEMPAQEADFAFYLVNPGHLQEDDRHFTLTNEEIELLNPNTRTCPIFRSKKDAELTKKIYRKHPVLIKENPDGKDDNPWGISFLRMFDMSNDSSLFRTEEELIEMGFELDGNIFRRGEETYLPLYEGKMIWFYDHRFAEFSHDAKGYGTVGATIEQHQDPDWESMPRYWVREEEVEKRVGDDVKWLLGFRGITNTTNEKTAIFSIFPGYGIGNSLPIIPTINDVNTASLFIAISSSFVFDYISRQKIAGLNLNFHFVEQFPMPDPIAGTRIFINIINTFLTNQMYNGGDYGRSTT